MTDYGPPIDFGPGSQGAPFTPSPGFVYAGDAYCWSCREYRPTERSGLAPSRFVAHGPGCPGSLRPVVDASPDGEVLDF